MCYHGTYATVSVINQQPNQNPMVDACIADEIQSLNDAGVVTLGSCCGHGQAGKITEWENGNGSWKGYINPPHTLIQESSRDLAIQLGYRPFPYYYANGEYSGILQMFLKTGCLTPEECDKWHRKAGGAKWRS